MKKWTSYWIRSISTDLKYLKTNSMAHGVSMRVIIMIVLMAFSISSFADKTMRCERCAVNNNKKQDRTVFTLTLHPTSLVVLYKKHLAQIGFYLPALK
jgi:hypothetical protein